MLLRARNSDNVVLLALLLQYGLCVCCVYFYNIVFDDVTSWYLCIIVIFLEVYKCLEARESKTDIFCDLQKFRVYYTYKQELQDTVINIFDNNILVSLTFFHLNSFIKFIVPTNCYCWPYIQWVGDNSIYRFHFSLCEGEIFPRFKISWRSIVSLMSMFQKKWRRRSKRSNPPNKRGWRQVKFPRMPCYEQKK